MKRIRLVWIVILLSQMRAVEAHGWLDKIFVYYPLPWEEADWSRIAGFPIENVSFTTEDGRTIHAWHVPAKDSAGLLLWCHGNGGNISHRIGKIALLRNAGLSVFIFDYRGYGKSDGSPTEEGFYRDARAAYRYVREDLKIPSRDIIAYGVSLGGAVAAKLASERSVSGLILEAPLPGVASVAKAHYFGLPLHLLLKARFPLLDYLPMVKVPVFVAHGDKDRIVPFRLGKKVFDAAGEPKEFHLIPGGGHNDLHIVGGQDYAQTLSRFVKQLRRAD